MNSIKNTKITKFGFENVETEEVNEFYEVQTNFESFVSTIVMFIEHEPYSKIAMNLDTNYRRVLQENYKKVKNGMTMEQSIFQDKGNTFRNSSVKLLFYEKVNDKSKLQVGMVTTEETPKIFSMSKCRLNQEINLNIDGLKEDLELSFEYDNVSAQYVTLEAYQQLLFLMGLKFHVNADIHQDYKLIFRVFKMFHMGTTENFKRMLKELDFPFLYDDNKSLSQNRHEFNSFFSCLTNVRCAVVKGGHRIEASCCILQGYKLGDPLPLEYRPDIVVPATSTLFKLIPTKVYYCRSGEMQLNQDHLNSLKAISDSIAINKQYFLEKDWKWWWTKLLTMITDNDKLKKVLFKYQSEFNKEEVNFREIGKETQKIVKIRTVLHDILSKAIFENQPCSNLIHLVKGRAKPTIEKWKKPNSKWLLLTADPYQLVSEFTSDCFSWLYFYFLIL